MKSEARFEHEMIQSFENDEVIFEEGETGRDLYIVQQGYVRVTKNTVNEKIEIAQFSKGDFFGDMSLLQSLPRYATDLVLTRAPIATLTRGKMLVKLQVRTLGNIVIRIHGKILVNHQVRTLRNTARLILGKTLIKNHNLSTEDFGTRSA